MGDLIAYLLIPRDEKEYQGVAGILYLPQPEPTKLLFEKATTTGMVTVHFEETVIRTEQNVLGVRETARRCGTETTFQASYMVGADGGQSANRKLLDNTSERTQRPETLFIDFLFENPNLDANFPSQFVVYPIYWGNITPLRFVEAGKRTLYRCAVSLDPEDQTLVDEMNSITHITSLLEEMLPSSRPINAYVMNSSLYRIYQLCASTFRRGRYLLAGDAANLNNVRVATHLSPKFLEEFGLPFFQQWRVDLKEVISQTL